MTAGAARNASRQASGGAWGRSEGQLGGMGEGVVANIRGAWGRGQGGVKARVSNVMLLHTPRIYCSFAPEEQLPDGGAGRSD